MQTASQRQLYHVLRAMIPYMILMIVHVVMYIYIVGVHWFVGPTPPQHYFVPLTKFESRHGASQLMTRWERSFERGIHFDSSSRTTSIAR